MGLGEVQRGRPGVALAGLASPAPSHPTTGIWFVGWIGVALLVGRGCGRCSPQARPSAPQRESPSWPRASHRFQANGRRTWLLTLTEGDYLFATKRTKLSAVDAERGVPRSQRGGLFLARRRSAITQPRDDKLVTARVALVAVFVANACR